MGWNLYATDLLYRLGRADAEEGCPGAGGGHTLDVYRTSATQQLECGDAAALQRDVPVLSRGVLIALVLEHVERVDEARPGLSRVDDVVHISPCGGDVGVGELLAILLDAFLGDGFALIGLGVSPRSWVDADDLPTWQALITRALYIVPEGSPWPEVAEGEVAVRDSSSELREWARIEQGIIVVRPDRQVFGVYGPDDWKMAAGGVREALGLR